MAQQDSPKRVHPQGLAGFTGAVLPLLEGGVARLPFTESLARAADAFVRQGLTGCDAAYAALARDLGGLWLTLDARAHGRIATAGVSWCVEQALPEDAVFA